jgi:hypothetical protein
MQGNQKQIGQLIAKAWADEAFKARLKSDPRGALAEAGFDVPQGHNVRVVEDTADTTHVVLPVRPSNISDEQLSSQASHPDICKPLC